MSVLYTTNRRSDLTTISVVLLRSLVTASRLNYPLPALYTSEHHCMDLCTGALTYHRHFGKDIIANNIQASLDDPQVHTLWLKLYKVRNQLLV